MEITLRPNAVGDLSELNWYPTEGVATGEHWDKVDEVVADEFNSYVEMTPGVDVLVYKRDLYTLPISGGVGVINSVKAYARVKINVSYGQVSIKTHDTVYDVTLPFGTAWSTKSNTWANNPFTGAAWTWAEIDALEAGVSLRGVSSGNEARCTQVYVEVATSGGTYTLRPNGAGSETAIHRQWLYQVGWERVDDVTPDEDVSCVTRYGGALGTSEDDYNLDDLGIAAIITNVQVVARVRRYCQNPAGSGTTRIGLGVRVGGGSYYSNTDTNSNSYFNLTQDYATNPATGVAWTLSDIDSLQSCLRQNFVNYLLVEGGLTSSRCTQLYIVVTYTALAPPTPTTNPATSVESAAATLNGTLDDDGGEACDCGFEWGETIAYGNTTPTQSRTTGQTFAQTISGLDPGQTYHFRAFATNAAGTSYGADRTVTTEVDMPSVTTDPATDLSVIAATLNGTLDDDGGEACECGFEWGLDTGYGTTTPTESKTTGETFSQVIGGLDHGTTYHFRAFATNSAGTGYGADRTFATALVISKAYSLERREL